MNLLAPLLGVALATACSPAPPVLPSAADRAAYLHILQDRSKDWDVLLAGCYGLSDAMLAGDCALFIANRAMKGSRTALETWCPRVPEGVWRFECHFNAAENARRRGDAAQAAALCQRAGPFTDDCGQHLWQTAVRELVRTPGPAAFPQLLPRAEALYTAWSPLLSTNTDFEDRFWQRFYQNGFEPQDALDLAACTPLPPPQDARCGAAAAALYRRRLEMALLPPGALDAFCQAVEQAALPSRVMFLQRYLAAPDDPRLQIVVEELATARCGGD